MNKNSISKELLPENFPSGSMWKKPCGQIITVNWCEVANEDPYVLYLSFDTATGAGGRMGNTHIKMLKPASEKEIYEDWELKLNMADKNIQAAMAEKARIDSRIASLQYAKDLIRHEFLKLSPPDSK